MIMKKFAVSFILFFLSLVNYSTPAYSQMINDDVEMSLTLKDAIEVAQKEALKWNKEAMLFNGLSVDIDET